MIVVRTRFPGGVDSLLTRLAATLAGVAAVVLVLLVLLTVADVGFRYFLASPIRGAHELTQVMMLAVVLLSLAFCEMRGGHIRVDVMDHALGPRGRRICDAGTAVLGAATLLAMAHRAILRAVDAWEYEDASSFLEIPLWPHYALIAFGIMSYALAMLIRGLLPLAVDGEQAHD